MATEKNKQLIKVHQHEIFTIIENTQKKTFTIACGDSLVCEKEFKTLKAAKEHCDKKEWSLMTNVMCYLFDKLAQMHTNQLKQQQHETEQKVLAESK